MLVMLMPMQAASAANDSLGIGLTVIPINDGSNANLSFNNQLWFGIEQGKSFTRQFEVSSASTIAQRLEFQLFDVMYDNGSRTIRTDRASLTADWVTFSPNNIIIPPNGNVSVKMTYTIPVDIKDSSFESFLRVSATAANLPKPSKSGTGVQVVLPGATAIDTPVWLGIGDPQTLVSDFDIKKVLGVLIDGTKKLRLVIKNSGKTPLGLDGTVQLTDATFSERTFGPFSYRTAELRPGKEIAVDIEMPEEVTEGKWKIFVVAEQGNIRKSKVFEEDITFKPLGSNLPIRLLFSILALVGIYFGWRLLKKPSNNAAPVSSVLSPSERLKRRRIKDEETAPLDPEFEEFLARLRSHRDEPVKKKVAKKAAAKKAPAKRIASKKAASKKAVTKKAIAKKTLVKKAVVKKAVVKKAVAKWRS